jgi:hypothetical protein
MSYPAAGYDLLPLYNLAKQGKIFSGNIAAGGVVLPIYSNNTQQVGLWNPLGSGVDLVLLRIALTLVDTTGAAGGFVLGELTSLGAAVATGTNITAFTETAAVSAYPGGGFTAKAKFGQGATLAIVGSAVTIKRHIGLNQLVLTPATTGAMQWEAAVDFAGDLVIPPGSAAFLAGNIATLDKFAGSLTWAEIGIVA